MAKIYFVNAQGKRVFVEVTDEVAQQYRESMQDEWRRDAYEKYYSKSLEGIIEAGHDFVDEQTNIEEMIVGEESERLKSILLENLHKALETLLPEQKELLTEIYFRGVTQREIAEREGVDESAISKRMDRIYKRLKKFFEKNQK